MSLALLSNLVGLVTADEPPHVNGDAMIRAPAGDSEIVIRTTDRLAGAIDSLRFRGREYIDSTDHGRQLQSAASYDCGLTDRPFWAECYNPTEAGSRRDGAGATSSSRLIYFSAGENLLLTAVEPAFWLAPDEESSGRPALNKTVLATDHRIVKNLCIGYQDYEQIISYRVIFRVPEGEHQSLAQFEALTGYMPSDFSKFYTLRPESGELKALDDGPGEQEYPVVFATDDNRDAMGIYAFDQSSKGYGQPGYGRFRFPKEKVVKWNCVFRIRNTKEIAPIEYSFPMFVIVGTLEEVRTTMTALARELKMEVSSTKPPRDN